MILFWVSCAVLASVVGKNVVDTKPQVDGRIVGGENARIEDYPYQVSTSLGCGGSILSSRVIITAAHCVIKDNARNVIVYSGSSYLLDGFASNVSKIITHEKYNRITKEYDVSLLILTEPLKFSDTIQPINLPKEFANPRINESAVVTGWGALYPGGPPSVVLQRVDVLIVDQNECVAAYKKVSWYPAITQRMLCAGYLGIGGKDGCQGDSGGPLASNGTLYGITSHGYGCGKKDFPGVYTRVSVIVPWIKYKINLYLLSAA